MSSTISQTEVKTLTSCPAVAQLRTEDKQLKLVRSSSMETIKRFNTFICSQQYYILPAILSWLKTSQSGLQTSTEKTIFFFRSLFFKSIFCKYFVNGIKSSGIRSSQDLNMNLINIKNLTKTQFSDMFTKCFETNFLLAAAVYGACAIVVVQFLTTIYLLYIALVPYGFLFLVGCMATIKYIYYKTLFSYMSKSTKSKIKKF